MTSLSRKQGNSSRLVKYLIFYASVYVHMMYVYLAVPILAKLGSMGAQLDQRNWIGVCKYAWFLDLPNK